MQYSEHRIFALYPCMIRRNGKMNMDRFPYLETVKRAKENERVIELIQLYDEWVANYDVPGFEEKFLDSFPNKNIINRVVGYMPGKDLCSLNDVAQFLDQFGNAKFIPELRSICDTILSNKFCVSEEISMKFMEITKKYDSLVKVAKCDPRFTLTEDINTQLSQLMFQEPKICKPFYAALAAGIYGYDFPDISMIPADVTLEQVQQFIPSKAGELTHKVLTQKIRACVNLLTNFRRGYPHLFNGVDEQFFKFLDEGRGDLAFAALTKVSYSDVDLIHFNTVDKILCTDLSNTVIRNKLATNPTRENLQCYIDFHGGIELPEIVDEVEFQKHMGMFYRGRQIPAWQGPASRNEFVSLMKYQRVMYNIYRQEIIISDYPLGVFLYLKRAFRDGDMQWYMSLRACLKSYGLVLDVLEKMSTHMHSDDDMDINFPAQVAAYMPAMSALNGKFPPLNSCPILSLNITNPKAGTEKFAEALNSGRSEDYAKLVSYSANVPENVQLAVWECAYANYNVSSNVFCIESYCRK